MNVKKVFQKITFLNEPYTRWKWRERRVSYGKENPDKTFYVIRRASCKVGLFSHVMTNMGLVKYALDRGYIPVIDMQNTQNTYLEPNQVGKVNAWEFYFEQPCGYSLRDIKKSKNVILSNGLITKENEYPDVRIADDEKELRKWQVVFKTYFHIKESLLNEYRKEKSKLWKNEQVLGVLARGTDYVSLKPHNHPIQPTAQQVADKVQRVMEKAGYEFIFLATEDMTIFQYMKERFGNRLLTVDAPRYTTLGEQNINDLHDSRKNGRYLKGKEYLFSIWLLTQCKGIVAGNVGGTHGALLMKQEYEYKYIFHLGSYI